MGNTTSVEKVKIGSAAISSGCFKSTIMFILNAPIVAVFLAGIAVGGIVGVGAYRYLKTNGKTFGHKEVH